MNELISIDQSAFLPNHSTHTCIHRTIDDWLESFNEKELVAACFLDISKCFDSIDHILLLKKLQCYGIKDEQLKWFSSYLFERRQMVFCHGILSNSKTLSNGIPQGSVLGPILFLLFINDIAQSLKTCTCNMFADDVVI